MRLLYLTDRLSERGGADRHLAQVVGAALAAGARVTVAAGWMAADAAAPAAATVVRLRALASATASGTGLDRLEALVAAHDVVHVQNVMNPCALAVAVAGGRTVVTVQDHRVFCPGPGKSLPDGTRCRRPMAEEACVACLRDDAYRARLLALTVARRNALAGARLLVLSRYMAEELATVGLGGAEVIPPWVEVGSPRTALGEGLMLGGRLVAHKGVLAGWRAWRAAATGQELLVAGSGPLEPELVGCTHLGWLGPDALRRCLRTARALLFPARWQEPFGILGVEALAEGTPVIVAEVGGTGEWSDAGCLVVPAADEAAMAAAIARLAADPDLALELGRAGQALVAARFARGPLERKLLAVYQEVA